MVNQNSITKPNQFQLEFILGNNMFSKKIQHGQRTSTPEKSKLFTTWQSQPSSTKFEEWKKKTKTNATDSNANVKKQAYLDWCHRTDSSLETEANEPQTKWTQSTSSTNKLRTNSQSMATPQSTTQAPAKATPSQATTPSMKLTTPIKTTSLHSKSASRSTGNQPMTLTVTEYESK